MDTRIMTDRSRLILKIAEREAIRLGGSDIEPEHILLALAIERRGVGGCILHYMGASAESIKEKIQHVPSKTSSGAEPNQWSEESEQCIQRALKEAKLLGHNYLGTEHLILGVVSTTSGRVPEVLRALGICPASLRAEVYALLGHEPSGS